VTIQTQVLSDCVTTVCASHAWTGPPSSVMIASTSSSSYRLSFGPAHCSSSIRAYCFASEHLSVSGNTNLTRPLRMWDAPIERSDELTERGLNAAPCGYAAEPSLGHWDTLTLRCFEGKVLHAR